jgi:LmbE family N-acetylglucosaminyl deacetylase
MPNRLVVLAHPDDEMLCLPFLLDETTPSGQVDHFLYLTFNSLSEGRKRECVRAVRILDQEIRESRLVEFESVLRDGHSWKDFKIGDINEFFHLLQFLDIDSILTFAYEGGHQDHDFAHVISIVLQSAYHHEIIEFSGYRKHEKFPLFVACMPVIKLFRVSFPRAKALKLFLRLAATHKSQMRVWTMLSPPIMLNLIFGSTYATRSALITTNPIKGVFLYEIRGKAKRESVEDVMLEIINGCSKGN